MSDPVQIIKWMAGDGEEFDTEIECLRHECRRLQRENNRIISSYEKPASHEDSGGYVSRD